MNLSVLVQIKKDENIPNLVNYILSYKKMKRNTLSYNTIMFCNFVSFNGTTFCCQ